MAPAILRTNLDNLHMQVNNDKINCYGTASSLEEMSMLKSYEVGFITIRADAKPNAITVKLFDRNLAPVVKAFARNFGAHAEYIGTSTEDYDEYWLEFYRDVRGLYRLMSLWLWIAVSDLNGVRRLADCAASEVGDAKLESIRETRDYSYELVFEVHGQHISPFVVPVELMDEAALNGQSDIEEDIAALFVDFIVRHLMRMGTSD